MKLAIFNPDFWIGVVRRHPDFATGGIARRYVPRRNSAGGGALARLWTDIRECNCRCAKYSPSWTDRPAGRRDSGRSCSTGGSFPTFTAVRSDLL